MRSLNEARSVSAENLALNLNLDIEKMRQFKDGSQVIYVPGGCFQMGSSTGNANEQPVHTVQLDGFYMDQYEVTNGQFERFVNASPQWQKSRIDSQYH